MATCTDEKNTSDCFLSADAVRGATSSPKAANFANAKASDGDPVNDRVHQDTESVDQLLPPADGGLVAWRFLFAAFTMEAFQWGRLQVSNTCTKAHF